MAEVIRENEDINFVYKGKHGMMHAVDTLKIAEKNVCEGGKIIASTVPIYGGWPTFNGDAVMVDLQTMEAMQNNKAFDLDKAPQIKNLALMLR